MHISFKLCAILGNHFSLAKIYVLARPILGVSVENWSMSIFVSPDMLDKQM